MTISEKKNVFVLYLTLLTKIDKVPESNLKLLKNDLISLHHSLNDYTNPNIDSIQNQKDCDDTIQKFLPYFLLYQLQTNLE